MIFFEGSESQYAGRLLESFGIARDRIVLEERSRNTLENAIYSKDLANPKAGERWLLVTSAYHMPRAIGVFRQAGFMVEAYPADWRTRGPVDALRPFATAWRWIAPHRHGGARMDWAPGVLVYRQILEALSRTAYAGRLRAHDGRRPLSSLNNCRR
jgi:uncharacterized SAM-binding protein YcdF (DUF218 family)